MARYRQPDTSDKRDEETWVAYWDRKRRHLHRGTCRGLSACVLCRLEDVLEPLAAEGA